MKETVYNKLVRDLIPQVVEADGQVAVVRELKSEEFRVELVRKLHEEVAEFSLKPSVDELADIQEVVLALAEMLGADASQLEAVRQRKKELRGGFGKRLFLEVTRVPGAPHV